VISLPQSWIAWAVRKGMLAKPAFTCVDVPEAPLDHELEGGVVYRERRGGHSKWGHLKCPRCGEHIQLPIGGSRESWSLRMDWRRRPTLHPSIWETDSCGAHFFIREGAILWCDQRRSISRSDWTA
jgi:hypothetical protein